MSTYIFGAICPEDGAAPGPTEAIAHQLAAVSKRVRPGRHVALLLDQAGGHTFARPLLLCWKPPRAFAS